MSQFPDASFVLSANDASQFPPDRGAEVAFAGRSNAGKSSAINALINRRQFAKTSKTPGRTQLINFFDLATDQQLVDLPGYGFARVSDKVRDHWGRLITGYFVDRQCLQGLFVIVDVRRGVLDGDLKMLELAASVDLPTHILLSKADKLKRGQAANVLQQTRRSLGDSASVQLFSALKKSGLTEGREVLAKFLASAG